MTDQLLAACIYPNCRGTDDQPRWTTVGMCPGHLLRYAALLDWLVIDYVTLRTWYPSPAQRDAGARRGKPQSFGHPAEWASDHAANIAGILNETEHDLREWLDMGAAVHQGHSEARRVQLAYLYTKPRVDVLATYPGASAKIVELDELHHHYRRAMGYTRKIQYLPCPCPSCDLRSLAMRFGDEESISCGSCGRIISQAEYSLFTRIVIDDLIDAYDHQNQQNQEAI